MRKRKYIVPCEKDYCDYVPCVEERIARLEEQGLDSGELRKWLTELREQDGRMWDAEAAWLEAIDKGVALV